MSAKTKRLSRLEAHSKWGGPDELESCDVVVMRIPEGADGDPRCEIARKQYQSDRRSFAAISFVSAVELPLWQPVSADRVSNELLEDMISWTMSKLDMEPAHA